MTKAIIFDMDGTLIDSEPIHKIARDKMLTDLGIFSEELSDRAVARAKREFWQETSDNFGLSLNGEMLTHSEFAVIINIIKTEGVKKSAGIDELLLALDERKIKMAVASSSGREYVEFIIDHFGWRRYFSAVVCGDDVKKSKPDPEIYFLALSKLGISSEEAFAVEDSLTGSRSAFAAGIGCVGFKGENAIQNDFSHCFSTVDDMREILNLL